MTVAGSRAFSAVHTAGGGGTGGRMAWCGGLISGVFGAT